MTALEIIAPRSEMLGPLSIRRVLPSPQRKMVGPFIFMDHGGPAEIPLHHAQGVAEHPHAGLATFTYLLAGTMIHRDSANNFARIEAGDIALMTAGSGITHEERPDREDPSPMRTAFFLQMWLALPDRFEDMPPDFEMHKASDLPSVDLSGVTAKVLIGTAWGKRAPTTTYCETLFADLLCSPMSTANLPGDIEERAIYLLEGDARIGDQEVQPHSLVIVHGDRTERISTVSGCRAIIFGGARFASPRVIAGSFVGSSLSKVQAWQQAYNMGEFPSINRTDAA
ncbi:MAG: pirin family protein [Pseudomonadota bacterium]